MADKIILNQIYALRIENNITIQQLAKLSGLSIGAISDIESGKEMPTHLTMLKICKGFNMMLEQVFENNYKNVNIV